MTKAKKQKINGITLTLPGSRKVDDLVYDDSRKAIVYGRRQPTTGEVMCTACAGRARSDSSVIATEPLDRTRCDGCGARFKRLREYGLSGVWTPCQALEDMRDAVTT